MIKSILTQSTSTLRFNFSVCNSELNDTETSTAVFLDFPSSEDWKEWLKDWNALGYELVGEPVQTS